MTAPTAMQIPGFQGDVIVPDRHDYDDARAVWNGTVDRRPRLIARCSGTADVAAAVRFARDRDLEIAPENLDPYVALWSMCNALRPDRLPDQRVVVRLDFTGFRPHERYWLLLEHGEAEICKIYLGLDEDLYITADAEAFVKWHAGQLSWAEATRDSRIQLHGPSWLVRAFPTWNGRSMFAHIKPDAAAATAN